MTFLGFLISSVILSLVGMAVYYGFRPLNPGFRIRRVMLWTVLALSFGLPLLHPSLRVDSHSITPHVQSADISNVAPITLNEFCSCTDPGAHDVIMYNASRVYDVILGSSSWLLILLVGVSVGFFVAFMIRLWMVTRMSVQSKKVAEATEVDGKLVWLVRGWDKSQAGSLRWFGRFIFWNDQLNQLDEKERQSVIWHEYSHIRQQNTLEKLILCLIQTVWFFNPVIYLMRAELEALSEYTADDYAAGRLGDKKRYASMLLKVKTAHRVPAMQMLGGSRLKKRITVLLGNGRSRSRRMIPAALAGFALLVIGDLYADSVIREQMKDFVVYELINRQHDETGKTEFCKKCTYEKVEAHCY